MSKLKKLVFFGTEDFSLTSLKALATSDWRIEAVVTKPDARRGRGRQLAEPAVKKIASHHGIKVLQPRKLAEIADELRALGCEMAVLVAYGKIIPQNIIDIFPAGIINLHPSLLPKYRGPAPIEAAILNGDKKTGLSLMKLIAEMDAGPVYAQKEVPLSGNETRPRLYDKLARLGADFLLDNLPKIGAGQLEARPQDGSKATYTKLLTKDDGIIDLNKPADQLERQVRAYLGWPKSAIELFGQPVIVTKARVAQSETDGDLVVKANPGYLEIEELIAPSGRTISGADFRRGYSR